MFTGYLKFFFSFLSESNRIIFSCRLKFCFITNSDEAGNIFLFWLQITLTVSLRVFIYWTSGLGTIAGDCLSPRGTVLAKRFAVGSSFRRVRYIPRCQPGMHVGDRSCGIFHTWHNHVQRVLETRNLRLGSQHPYLATPIWPHDYFSFSLSAFRFLFFCYRVCRFQGKILPKAVVTIFSRIDPSMTILSHVRPNTENRTENSNWSRLKRRICHRRQEYLLNSNIANRTMCCSNNSAVILLKERINGCLAIHSGIISHNGTKERFSL